MIAKGEEFNKLIHDLFLNKKNKPVTISIKAIAK